MFKVIEEEEIIKTLQDMKTQLEFVGKIEPKDAISKRILDESLCYVLNKFCLDSE